MLRKAIVPGLVALLLAGCGSPNPEPIPQPIQSPATPTTQADQWTTTFAVRGTVDPVRGWEPALAGGNDNCGYVNNGDDAGIDLISVWANASGTDTLLRWSLFISDGSGHVSQSVEGALPLTLNMRTNNESFSKQPEGLFGVEPVGGGIVVNQDIEFTVDIEWAGPEVPDVYLGGITCVSGS